MANSKDVQAQLDRIGRGEQMEAGWCFNAARRPEVFRCDEEMTRVANGEISLSHDGTMVTDLATGETKVRDQPKFYREMAFATPATVTGATPAATGADTKTTDNAPARVNG